MDNKKGFEIQFNWIFVLIVGAIIIIFFTTIIVRQKGISETSNKAAVLKGMESIIAGSSVSISTTGIIDTPDSEVGIGCNNVAVGTVSKQYQNLILFAPSLIKGTKLIWQTLPFNVPFRTTNILYMTSPKVRYWLIGDDSDMLFNEINDSLPKELDKKKLKLGMLLSITNSNNYKVKLVFVNTPLQPNTVPDSLKGMPDADVTAVKISGDEKKGTIEFYEKTGNSWTNKGTSSYFGTNHVLGAVYAGQFETYDCNTQHIFSRTSIVAKIYLERTNMLKNVPSLKLSCVNSYAMAISSLGIISLASPNAVSNYVAALNSNYQQLKNENKKLEENSCPLIY